MKRRDVLRKASGAFALLPLFCLGRTKCSPYEKEIRGPIETSDFKLPHWYTEEKSLLDRETVAGQNSEFAYIYGNPCKEIKVPRFIPPAPWYDLDDFTQGNIYLNTVTNAYWIHQGTHWGTNCTPYGLASRSSRRGMLCPSCIMKRYPALYQTKEHVRAACDKMLSIVCNTQPPNPSFVPIDCVCGHPWLETAHEDYILWKAGETDEERQTRRGYPSILEWVKEGIRAAYHKSEKRYWRRGEV